LEAAPARAENENRSPSASLAMIRRDFDASGVVIPSNDIGFVKDPPVQRCSGAAVQR
jgi:hypothetical protein